MRLLWFFVLVHIVVGQNGFGISYLKNSKLCHQWSCINTKLGLPNALPRREEYTDVLKTLLPLPKWRKVIDKAIDVCYNDRPRRYTNTCPGQALMHCIVESLIQNCPEENWRKGDACAPITSLAGFKYMFSQSRYENLETNLPTERRPAWFLRNYFSSKCCDIPEMFSAEMLSECDFSSFIKYHVHPQQISNTTLDKKPPINNENKLKKAVEDSVNNEDVMPLIDDKGPLHVVSIEGIEKIDPLDCCDLSGFITPSFRSECDFHVTWNKENRLTISNESKLFTTTQSPTTAKPLMKNDVKIVPQSCDQETCVFRKLNILSENGTVDLDAFSKLLDNMTAVHSSWLKAKARVVTKCLSRRIVEYTDDCEINKVLACTFDVLSESCPHAKKNDPCKHTTIVQDNVTCQISSSKYRPKNRRKFCGLPSLVSHEVLKECGVNSLTRMEFVPDPASTVSNKPWWTDSKTVCQSSTESTKCVLKKMDVLNKYRFLDYFRMKDKIRTFTSNATEWTPFTDVYLNAFSNIPMYMKQCSTSRKFLNVIDAMLMTCPMSKRKFSLQCNRILTEMANVAPKTAQKPSLEKFNRLWSHFGYLHPPTSFHFEPKFPTKKPITQKKPMFDFGFLNSKDAPPVEIIDVKPVTYRPKVMLPVYLRMNGEGKGAYTFMPVRDGILRGGPHTPPTKGEVQTMTPRVE